MKFILLLLVCRLVGLNGQLPPPTAEDRFESPQMTATHTEVSTLTEQCIEQITCNLTGIENEGFPEMNCYCDNVCAITGDCCPGYKPDTKDLPNLSKEAFECVKIEGTSLHFEHGVSMVTKCNGTWPEDEIKRYCESSEAFDGTLFALPVTDPITNIIFRNMYCSFCNYKYDYRYWTVLVKCNNITKRCHREFKSPPTYHYRACPLDQYLIDSCETSGLSVLNNDTESKCENGSYSLMYAGSQIYKNKHCAKCNGISESFIQCVALQFISSIPHYSYRMLVDFNGLYTDINNQKTPFTKTCKENEIYDPTSDECREIHCPAHMRADNGKCVPKTSNVPETLILGNFTVNNCTYVKLGPSEFQVINATRLLVISSNTYYDEDMFYRSNASVFICLSEHPSTELFTFKEVEGYLSFVAMIISLVSLAVTFIVYTFFRELLNTPGKILICLISALFCAQLLFLLAPYAEGNPGLCKAVAVFMHYCFLAAFSWMNIVALDLWMTFSGHFITPGSGNKSTSRFIKFCMYGWVVPLIVVIPAFIVDSVELDDTYQRLQPGYGRGVCWITSGDSLLLFFAGPLALLKLFDIVAFIFTSINIVKAKRQGAMARRETNVCSFLINLKLSLVIGLTWVFAFVAIFGGHEVLWILFIVFNCLQGFFIAISFLCTKKVKRLVKNKYGEVFEKSSTHMTSLNN